MVRNIKSSLREQENLACLEQENLALYYVMVLIITWNIACVYVKKRNLTVQLLSRGLRNYETLTCEYE